MPNFFSIRSSYPVLAVLALTLGHVLSGAAQAQLSGELGAHDPSTLHFENGRYYYFATGNRLAVRSSADLTNWVSEPAAFDAVPSWVPGAVPGYTGESLWAPDLIELDDTYYLYYSASIFGTRLSGIGYATSPTIDPDAPNYGWTDHGIVIESDPSNPYNAIDPALMLDDETGRLWMTWGSFNNGIYVKELNPTNGAPLSNSPGVNVAAAGPTSEIEGASMIQRDGYYYLFVNWGGCCNGIDSTYNIRVGRSTTPTGPFLDREGINLLSGGGSLFLDDDGRKIGPGHFGLLSEGGQDQFSYHYYDADRVGAPTFGLQDFHWTEDAWPRVAEAGGEWAGGTEAHWSDAGVWTYGTMPDGAGHVADFVGGASPRSQRRVLMGSDSRTIGSANFRGRGRVMIGTLEGPTLFFNGTGGETATINVLEGSPTINAPVAALDDLEINVPLASSEIRLNGRLSSPVVRKYGEGRLTLAGVGSSINGNLFVKRGTLAIEGSATATSFTSVGQILGDTATMSVYGVGSFTAQGDLNIGDTGNSDTPATGTLLIRDEGTVIAQTGLYVGSGFFNGTRAEGAVVQTGGTLWVQGTGGGEFVVGGRGSSQANGSYNLSEGVVTSDADVAIGGQGEGSFVQSGGIVDAARSVSLGRQVSGIGSWTITGGELFQSSTRSTLTVGNEGQGVLTIDGDGRVAANGAVRVAEQASSSGEIRLNGGVLKTSALVGGGGSSLVAFDGGRLQALRDNTAFLRGIDTARISTGGLVLDTQEYDVVATQPLTSDPALAGVDGGLQKVGSGRLTLASASSYTGETAIVEGVLEVANSVGSATGSGAIQIEEGAVLTGSGGVAGAVEVASGGTIDPGDAAATLTIGELTLQSGGKVAARVLGGGVGSELAVLGNASLTGDLIVYLEQGPTPDPEDAYVVLTADSLDGEFMNAPNETFLDENNGSGAFRVLYDGGNGEVLLADFQPVRFLAGDYNGDGQVDAADYTVWRDHKGLPAGTLWNDPTRGPIGVTQYDVWRANFGASLPMLVSNAADVVPEPSTFLLAGLLLVGGVSKRRFRH